MKKLVMSFFLSAMLLTFSTNTWAVEPVNLHEGYVDNTGHDGNGRSSPFIPILYIDVGTLQFHTSCDGYTLRLMQNGHVQYLTVIPTATHELMLPSTLSGEYQIQLITGNVCFYGTINL